MDCKVALTERHKLTKEKLNGNNLRVISYNLLANLYASREDAKSHRYPYCPVEYLDFNHRRLLLAHEIMNYNGDVIFLQECDQDFFDNDLQQNLCPLGYQGCFRLKHNKTEGEAIFFRKDRFKYIQSFDFIIADELRSNEIYKVVLDKMETTDARLKNLILSRNTLLQVILVESLEFPGNYLLLANTHLYFNPELVFLRLIQMIVNIKRIEELLSILKNKENKTNIGVLHAGDFNSEPSSLAVQYVFLKEQIFEALPKDQKQWIEGIESFFGHNLSLQTFTCHQYSVFTTEFKCLIDYIFYDQHKFTLKNVIPMLTEEELKENVALPSKKIPSDHLAVIYELEWKI